MLVYISGTLPRVPNVSLKKANSKKNKTESLVDMLSKKNVLVTVAVTVTLTSDSYRVCSFESYNYNLQFQVTFHISRIAICKYHCRHCYTVTKSQGLAGSSHFMSMYVKCMYDDFHLFVVHMQKHEHQEK